MTGRAVVITGGTRGIGLGLAAEFLARDVRVAICGRSQESVGKALAELGDGAVGVVCDMADRDQVQALWDAAAEAFGHIDHWINNAGVSTSRRPLTELPPDQLETVVSANLLGVMHGSAVAVRGMTAQGGGTVWNMAGLGSDGRTVPGLIAYGATKRGTDYLTTGLAKEVKDSPVKVAHLSPGMVVTDLLLRDYSPDELAKAKKIFNILADRVETVTPWLADRILAGTKNGGTVAWLTTPKIMGRFMLARFRRRDLFGEDA
ncbi:SDR family oxidoreductase [Actinomadura livida]|uniref:NAD(P)-dependent dehydrogenase (Short-subunit alcohol dehydrogenase family) n=1 Tax=Actinomadura livida TaxID=79909 RepID=A0A7W7I8X1_9ACTN|nr:MULTISPECIES: SDR family oxidoreductase [Actinomadura]MBB4772620.1 NAD(P)-dependent dehydrogenase (short-subunit alcohol dehydrogenase family) [Actinomadura catellatispora]GGU11666.1 short-chain dehydrogenase [Actinomadura livida]